MRKAAVVVFFAVSGHVAQAGSDGYYECTRPDWVVEYSLDKCEQGQEQRYIGSKELEATGGQPRKRNRQPAPAVAKAEQGPAAASGNSSEANLATYKCAGKAGDILYTDARDYVAFEIYRCTRIDMNQACEEARRLKAKDHLAVVSNKLKCPSPAEIKREQP